MYESIFPQMNLNSWRPTVERNAPCLLIVMLNYVTNVRESLYTSSSLAIEAKICVSLCTTGVTGKYTYSLTPVPNGK